MGLNQSETPIWAGWPAARSASQPPGKPLPVEASPQSRRLVQIVPAVVEREGVQGHAGFLLDPHQRLHRLQGAALVAPVPIVDQKDHVRGDRPRGVEIPPEAAAGGAGLAGAEHEFPRLDGSIRDDLVVRRQPARYAACRREIAGARMGDGQEKVVYIERLAAAVGEARCGMTARRLAIPACKGHAFQSSGARANREPTPRPPLAGFHGGGELRRGVLVREVQDQLLAALEGLLPDALDAKLASGDLPAAGKLQDEVLALECRDFSRAAIGDRRGAHAPAVQLHFPSEEFIADCQLVGLDADGYAPGVLGSRSRCCRSK